MDFSVANLLNDLRRVIRENFRSPCEDEGTANSQSTKTTLQNSLHLVQGEPFPSLQRDALADEPARQETYRSMSGLARAASQVSSKLSTPMSLGNGFRSQRDGFPEHQEHIEEIPLWNDAPRTSAPLLDNGGEIALANYRDTPRLALFLSPSIIADVANVLDQTREFEPLDKKFEELSKEIERLEQYLSCSNKFIEDDVTEDRRQEIIEKVQQRRENFERCHEQRQKLQREYDWQRTSLKRANKTLVNNLASLLSDKGLISTNEQLAASLGDQSMLEADSTSLHSDHRENIPVGEEDAQRAAEWAARDEAADRWYMARAARQRAEQDLEERDVIEQNMYNNYCQRIAAGESESAAAPEEGWDLFPFVLGSRLTQALTDAENEEKQATAQACAVLGGLPSGAPTELASNFPDHPNDGDVLSSEEEEARGAVRPEEIQLWMDMTPDSVDPTQFEQIAAKQPLAQGPSTLTDGSPGTSASAPIIIDDSEDSVKLEIEDPEPMEVDEWDISSLAFGEGISANFPLSDPRHEKIAKWHAKCEQEYRPQFAHQIQRDSVSGLEHSD